MAAERRGPHWRISDEESGALATALAQCARHIPLPAKQLGIAADIASLAVVAMAVFVPRLKVDRELRGRGNRRQQGTGAGGPHPSPPSPRQSPVPDAFAGLDIGL